MTGREWIGSRIGVWGILFFPTLVVLFLAFIVMANLSEMLALAMLGSLFVVGFGGGIALTARITCPYCQRWIGPVTGFSVVPIFTGIPRKVKHCPLCGSDFDSEISANNAANTASHGTALSRRP